MNSAPERKSCCCRYPVPDPAPWTGLGVFAGPVGPYFAVSLIPVSTYLFSAPLIGGAQGRGEDSSDS